MTWFGEVAGVGKFPAIVLPPVVTVNECDEDSREKLEKLGRL
jgi:hypothetical protein